MMDGCADRGQGLARDGVFGEFFDGDHLLAAWAIGDRSPTRRVTSRRTATLHILHGCLKTASRRPPATTRPLPGTSAPDKQRLDI
jgi:hypothetical protein